MSSEPSLCCSKVAPKFDFLNTKQWMTMNQQTETQLLLAAVLPEFASELRQLLDEQGEPELAAQVTELTILDRCRCGDDFCATVYTQPKPNGGFGPPPGWDRTRARRCEGEGLPVSPFRLRDGFTISPTPRFPRPPYNAGRRDFPGPV